MNKYNCFTQRSESNERSSAHTACNFMNFLKCCSLLIGRARQLALFTLDKLSLLRHIKGGELERAIKMFDGCRVAFVQRCPLGLRLFIIYSL